MTNLICIAYQPGSFGSFLGWTIERTSASRYQYHPRVVDDPLTADGSSRGHASYCKILNNQDFIEDLYDARKKASDWGYHVHAGWPVGEGEDMQACISMVLANLSTFDKMFVIECTDPIDHYVRYLRNEAMMDQDRWFGMLGINHSDQLLSRLRKDITQKQLDAGFSHPRLCRIGMNDFSKPAELLFDKVANHMSWPTRDRMHYSDVKERMWKAQCRYYDRVAELTTDEPRTPAELAVRRLIKGE